MFSGGQLGQRLIDIPFGRVVSPKSLSDGPFEYLVKL